MGMKLAITKERPPVAQLAVIHAYEA